ncbi:MAG: type 1 glutamine amidotransferase [Roseateles sp.]
MNLPLLIVQHDATQRSGFLLELLRQKGMAADIRFREEGDALPAHAQEHAGLVLLGSNRSVNEDLPWMLDERRLVRAAMAAGVPVLGHCFGAQTMARALGAPVRRNPLAHIGWSRLRCTAAGRAWFGGSDEITAFNWHYESFAIPRGATRLLYGLHCLNKGFAIGPHLALQCHLEVDTSIVRDWCVTSRAELRAVAGGPEAQSEAQIMAELPQRLAALRVAARHVYGRWLQAVGPRAGLVPAPKPPVALPMMALNRYAAG